VANVYAPCDNEVKQVLWKCLTEWVGNHVGENICICGDFNVVFRVEERKSVGFSSRFSDYAPFNKFIDANVLAGLPFYGPKLNLVYGRWTFYEYLDNYFLFKDWCFT